MSQLSPSASVLLVEDESKVRYFAGEVLNLEGISSATASDGCEAMAYLEGAVKRSDQLPRIVILDLYMPCMSGYEVYRKLCSAPWAHDLTVIITSAAGDGFEILAGVGQTLILQKPYAVSEFVSLLHQAAPDLFEHK
jgi:CheY-like chemotaxis protein